jgi:hypothetical protein
MVFRPTGRTLPEVVKGILFKREELEGGCEKLRNEELYNLHLRTNITKVTKAMLVWVLSRMWV